MRPYILIQSIEGTGAATANKIDKPLPPQSLHLSGETNKTQSVSFLSSSLPQLPPGWSNYQDVQSIDPITFFTAPHPTAAVTSFYHTQLKLHRQTL